MLEEAQQLCLPLGADGARFEAQMIRQIVNGEP